MPNWTSNTTQISGTGIYPVQFLGRIPGAAPDGSQDTLVQVSGSNLVTTFTTSVYSNTGGQFRLPSIIAGAWASGNISFASANGNFAQGETVTLNGTVFTAQSEGCIFNATTTSGSNQIVMLNAGFGYPVVGQTITGTGIIPATTIAALGAGPGGFGTLTMSANATATSAVTGVAVTGAGTYGTAVSTNIRWFPISATMPDSIVALLECIRNSNDQSAGAIAVNKGFFWMSSVFNAWKLNFQAITTLGNSYTLATTRAGATVTAPNGGTNGNLPVAASTYPPLDKGLCMVTISPVRNGAPGLAQYASATDSWTLL